jgi:imidazolonepropionase
MRTIVSNIGQLLTMDSTLHDLRSPIASRILGLVDDAAMVLEDGVILWLGPADELPASLGEGAHELDARGRVVMPGLVECHTHLVYGGNRANEFALRAAGASYEEIGRQGGGIASTVRATRGVGADALFLAGLERLDGFARMGVTTVEIKSGYGLDTDTELKLLEVIASLDGRHPVDVVGTFLGAHIVPPDFADRRDAYLDLICQEMIPAIGDAGLAEFCDVFVESGAFSVEEARRVLEAGLDYGLHPKVHAEQLSRTGASRLAAELGAISADHLDHANEGDAVSLARAETVAVLLPGATFYLGKQKYANGRLFVDAGAAVALSTDYNPGSSPTQNLWLMGTMACTHCGLSPAQALWAMTRGGARALGRVTTAGSLQIGRKADFLILQPCDWQELLYGYGHNPVSETYKAGKRL